MIKRVGVIGLGYVVLPLAIQIGREIEVRGFDINTTRSHELENRFDRGTQITEAEFEESIKFSASSKEDVLEDCDVYIITVPTPVDSGNKPDLSFLKAASRTVAKFLTKNNTVIYESTVYPGATEQICIPILEEGSGLSCGEEFNVGYSPERINPGDPHTSLQSVTKVISAINKDAELLMRYLYEEILGIETFLASNIKTAEAAKALENTQRDVNIALMNEMAVLFKKLDISIHNVLDAAETKWNFNRYSPGLVGGHCIRIDPYYLINVANLNNLRLKVTESSREVNDGMCNYVCNEVLDLYENRNIEVKQSNILILGITYKENFSDTRSSLVIDIIKKLTEKGIEIDIFDPVLNQLDKENMNLNFIESLSTSMKYNGLICAVGHSLFEDIKKQDIEILLKPKGFVYDFKSILPPDIVDRSL